ncbi:hypothetical protein FG05_35082 [Fusarium graminearum]|nr:hypothetical protein FG05_35082 [Fusarium graminearum]
MTAMKSPIPMQKCCEGILYAFVTWDDNNQSVHRTP